VKYHRCATTRQEGWRAIVGTQVACSHPGTIGWTNLKGEGKVAERKDDPPFDGGSQPVQERPPDKPTAAGSVMQTVVIVIGVLVLLAALLWLVVPFGG
jgi:hypothetical protein